MRNLMPAEISDEVREILLQVPTAGEYGRTFLTAYQILHRLPSGTRDRLIAERRVGGQGSDVYHAATRVVSDSAEHLPGIEIMAFDCRGTQYHVAGQDIAAGAAVVAIYRLKDGSYV